MVVATVHALRTRRDSINSYESIETEILLKARWSPGRLSMLAAHGEEPGILKRGEKGQLRSRQGSISGGITRSVTGLPLSGPIRPPPASKTYLTLKSGKSGRNCERWSNLAAAFRRRCQLPPVCRTNTIQIASMLCWFAS